MAAGTEVVVEFARSGKTHAVHSGQTLLEAAEDNVGPAKRNCWQGLCKWMWKRDSIPILKGQGFLLTCVGQADADDA